MPGEAFVNVRFRISIVEELTPLTVIAVFPDAVSRVLAVSTPNIIRALFMVTLLVE
jgi:hypothetical protein